MEHLLNDQDYAEIKRDIDDIPWLDFDHETTRQYNAVLLPSYPILRGWTQKRIDTLKLEGKPLDTVDELAMFQSWLFFGVLKAFLARHLASKDFVFDTLNGFVIQRRRLRGVISYAELSISNSNLENKKRSARLLRYALNIAVY